MNAERRLRAAELLEGAAELVLARPGTNVLDAFRHLGRPELEVGDAYYALLHDLEPHVPLLAPWSDTETAERVAHRCRRAAKDLRGELRVRRLG